MRYKIKSGIEIRSENAAKPETQQSTLLLKLLHKLPHVNSSFDYGCGKLRYQRAIEERTNTLALIDSEIQISRMQTIRGRNTSIREITKMSNQVEVLNDNQFEKSGTRYDRGFCINVLSVIPSYSRRNQALETIWRKLKSGGECLFVVQYRNSDFTRMREMRNAKPFLDGFLIDSLRGHSFYGIIQPTNLQTKLRKIGFEIRNTDLNEGSVYCWAVRP
jgi:hypothetical protein